ncbi:hypothetical protein MADP15_00415 [Mycoplasma anatis]|uniref:coiled-coil domain-containing protein n=1 Tax=Mycoplasmopsis anatis TaxID=171279 RepID=UPI001C4E09DA|nr:hypothetical protein [Mycoplasmopsis anatis]MBW0596116.1 hypothetical protein [Mycoplasmopsis anatis]MBW0596800.1 hypothetical protein [Mycoplasmopsis anatis]MBW0600086.1 hypothetical protein [Mycoplasmopsis anatis]MBW0600474.1 hypothetical protein [Mycoplasmopsis anatis]
MENFIEQNISKAKEFGLEKIIFKNLFDINNKNKYDVYKEKLKISNEMKKYYEKLDSNQELTQEEYDDFCYWSYRKLIDEVYARSQDLLNDQVISRINNIGLSTYVANYGFSIIQWFYYWPNYNSNETDTLNKNKEQTHNKLNEYYKKFYRFNVFNDYVEDESKDKYLVSWPDRSNASIFYPEGQGSNIKSLFYNEKSNYENARIGWIGNEEKIKTELTSEIKNNENNREMLKQYIQMFNDNFEAVAENMRLFILEAFAQNLFFIAENINLINKESEEHKTIEQNLRVYSSSGENGDWKLYLGSSFDGTDEYKIDLSNYWTNERIESRKNNNVQFLNEFFTKQDNDSIKSYLTERQEKVVKIIESLDKLITRKLNEKIGGFTYYPVKQELLYTLFKNNQWNAGFDLEIKNDLLDKDESLINDLIYKKAKTLLFLTKLEEQLTELKSLSNNTNNSDNSDKENERIKELENNLQNTIDQLSKIKDELKQVNSKYNEKIEEINKLNANIEEKNSENEQLKSENQTLQNNLESSLNEFNLEKNELNNQINDKNNQIDNLKDSNNKLSKVNNTLINKSNTLEKEKQELFNRTTDLETKNNELETKLLNNNKQLGIRNILWIIFLIISIILGIGLIYTTTKLIKNKYKTNS